MVRIRTCVCLLMVLLSYPVFPQSEQNKNSLCLTMITSWPLRPKEFMDNWNTGTGIMLQYNRRLDPWLEWTVSGAYVRFGIDGGALARQFNPSLSAGGAYEFQAGQCMTGWFRTGVKVALSDPYLSTVFSLQAGAGMYFVGQKDLAFTLSFPSQPAPREGTPVALGKDEWAPGFHAGLGVEFGIWRGLHGLLDFEGCCLLTKGGSDPADRAAQSVSRAQSRATILISIVPGMAVRW
jgi:hypothetical protein